MINVSDFNLTDYLFNVSKNFNCLADGNGNIIVANASFCEGVNISKSESTAKNFLDFVHPDDRQLAFSWINKRLALNARADLEIRYLNNTGAFEWMAWSAVKLPDQNMLYFSGRNIKNLKAREERLNLFLNDYQRIFDSSLDVICSMDKMGNYIRLNKAVNKMWGYQPEELLGTNYLNYIHPDDRESSISATEKIMAGEELKNFENRFIHKSGEIRHITWSAVWSKSDQVIFSVARDITELKKQQEVALMHERRLESLVQSGADLIAIISAEGVYTYISPSVKTTLGKQPEDYIGKTPYDFVHPDDVHIIDKAFREILTCEKIDVHSHRYQDAEGNWRWLQTVATNCLNDPAINGYICNTTDVTLLKERELRITEQNEKLKEIAQINSHELRKPVASILGVMQLMNEEIIKDELNITILGHLKTLTEELDGITKRIINNTHEEESKNSL
ncbi:PAS domain S-box protein [Mucilaginibacter sp. AW1-3]